MVERKADVRTDRGFLTASISARWNDARDQKWPGTPFDVHVHGLSSSLSPSLSLVPLWIFVRPTVLVRNVRQVKRSTHNRSGLNAGNYICRRVSNGRWSWSSPCWGSYCCGSLSLAVLRGLKFKGDDCGESIV